MAHLAQSRHSMTEARCREASRRHSGGRREGGDATTGLLAHISFSYYLGEMNK